MWGGTIDDSSMIFTVRSSRIVGQRQAGFSAVETIISIAIFVLFSLTLYGGYARILEALEFERYKSTAAQTANEQIELARNERRCVAGIIHIA